jgi:hypothetical protein
MQKIIDFSLDYDAGPVKNDNKGGTRLNSLDRSDSQKREEARNQTVSPVRNEQGLSSQ